jgi:hypothetical protein
MGEECPKHLLLLSIPPSSQESIIQNPTYHPSHMDFSITEANFIKKLEEEKP